MVNLQKSGDSAVRFVFTDSDHYLYGNGEIEVPVNSLLLAIDESEMVTFKKLSGDPFLSFRADNSNLGTKAAIEQFYKDNMVGSTGGGSESGITSGEVQEMIDESISGKADTTYVNQIASQTTDAITALTQTVSNNYTELKGTDESLYAEKFGDARYDSATHRINFYAHGNSTDILAYVDATDFIKDGMVSNVEIVNGNLVITFNSDAGKQPISIPLTSIFDPANYYTTAQTQSYVSGFTYDKATIDQKVAEGGTFDPTLYYDKTATDALLAAKADTATTYTKTEVDNALSSKADTSDVTAVANDVQTVSGQVATKVATSDFNTYTAATATALNGKVDTSALNDYYTKTEVYNKQEVDTAYETAYQALTAHTADTSIHVTSAEKTTWNNKSDFSGDYNDLTNKPTIPTVPTNISDFINDAGYITNADITGKADTTAVTAVNDALTAHTANTTVHVTSAEKDAWNAKVDTSAITTAITSGSTDAQVPSAKATYDAITAATTGGGATYSAGTNISIDTGNTINCTLNARNGSGTDSLIIGDSECSATRDYSIAVGHNADAIGKGSIVIGSNSSSNAGYSFVHGTNCTVYDSDSNATHCFIFGNQIKNIKKSYNTAFGEHLNLSNKYETSFGAYNNSVTGSTASGQTLFSVGNGTSSARHNAFEIRQNGDIYIALNGQDVKLQDQLGGGAGLDDDTQQLISTAFNDLNDRKADLTELSKYQKKGDYVVTSTLADYMTNASFDEYATAKERIISGALNDLNDKFGGIRLVKISQTDYDALTEKDENTLYIINNVI